jgi:perosamine synthetase
MTAKDIIPWARPDFGGNELNYAREALISTWVSGGPFVDRFESLFKNYCGVRYALSASSGTTALEMAYRALGVRPRDEIVVPGFAFMAAANIALGLGAKPVFAEVDPRTWCVTASDIRDCLTSRTRLIVPVHTYGNVCDMDDIMALAHENDITVVEDAAEAFPSRHRDRLAGTIATIGCFSFHAAKTITTGEGGMVVTDNQDLFAKMALYRNHGMLRKRYYWHELAGHNFRLTNLQAALGCAQMERLESIVRERKRVYERYRRRFSNIPGTALQFFASEVQAVPWVVVVKLDPHYFQLDRDAVISRMQEAGIETRPGFYAASLMKHLYDCKKLPICEEISKQSVSLPTYPSLRDEQVDYVCDTIENLRG